MGGARNLKLRRATGAINFFGVWSKCRPLLVVCMEKCSSVQGQNPGRGWALVKESGSEAPWSWNTFNFWTCNECLFFIFENAKKHKYLCFFAKITFDNLHPIMLKCTKGTLSLSKFFLGGKVAGRAGQLSACPLWRRPWCIPCLLYTSPSPRD